MKIGVIIAIADEFEAFQRVMGAPKGANHFGGYAVWMYDINGQSRIFAVRCGAGEIHAAAATQMLIDKYEVDLIVNFGICGGLTDDMGAFTTVLVNKVVHYDFDTSPVDGWEKARYPEYPDVYIPVFSNSMLTSEIDIREVTCASSDRFVADPELRKELHQLYGAEICEMEAAGILLTANAAGTPALLIKTVSDSLAGGAEEYKKIAKQAAEVGVDLLKRLEVIYYD